MKVFKILTNLFFLTCLLVCNFFYFCNIDIKIKNTENVKCEQIYDNIYNLMLKVVKNKNGGLSIKLIENNNEIEFAKDKNSGLTKLQKNIIDSGLENRLKVFNFAYVNGFNKEECLFYVFPELNDVVTYVKNSYCYEAKDACLKSKINTGNIFLQKEISGIDLDYFGLINDLFNSFKVFKGGFKANLHFFKTNSNVNVDYYKDKMQLKGTYKTYFNSSSDSRKNNIRQALSSLDGKIIMPDETLSFNNITGDRTDENGYMKANTIKNGSFFQEFGGGVCQVSSTFYNAALLANLDIIEVHPHSLPVSYVEPCFDAMVNTGSSDLKIKNNTKYPVIIACSSKNDTCLINIYGEENSFDIKRVSEKIESIENFEYKIINDYKLVGLDQPINKGETKIISRGKPGFKAIGMLEYYKDGVLFKTKKIRMDTYKPTNEVILEG